MTHFFRQANRNGEAGKWTTIKIHATVAASVTVLFFFADARSTLVIGGVLCFITYLYLGFREASDAPLWLSPLSYFFFWYSIGMGLSPIYVGFVTDTNGTVKFAAPGSAVMLDDLAFGYVLFLLGLLALHIGMHLMRPLSKAKTEPDTDRDYMKWLVAIWTVGLIFQLNPGSFSFMGATSKILSVAAVGSVSGFAVIPHKRLGLTAFSFVLILIVGTAGLFFGNLSSISKAYIMFSFLPVTWLFISRRRLRIWIPCIALALAAFYFAIVAPVVYTARQNPLEEGENPREHLLGTFDRWVREQPIRLDETFFADQLDQFMNRQFDAVPVGFIVGEVGQSGLLLGETLKYASYAFIPRLLWPEKPTVTRGAWFSTYLGLFQSESEATTSVGMTAVGELYWNYGLPGVITGMLAIGFLLGFLWRMAGADPRSKPIHMLLYVSTMLSVSDLPEAVTVFVSIAVTFLTFKAAFAGLNVIKRRRITQSLPYPMRVPS